MKRKFLMIFLSFLCTFSYASLGIGTHAGVNFSTDQDTFVSLTIKPDTSPWCSNINAHFSEVYKEKFEYKNTITFALDNWFINENLTDHLEYYILWGVSAGMYLKSMDEFAYSIGTGCRFGLGVELLCINRHLELFLQGVWNPYVGVKLVDNNLEAMFVPVNFPCSFGFRIWT